MEMVNILVHRFLSALTIWENFVHYHSVYTLSFLFFRYFSASILFSFCKQIIMIRNPRTVKRKKIFSSILIDECWKKNNNIIPYFDNHYYYKLPTAYKNFIKYIQMNKFHCYAVSLHKMYCAFYILLTL